LGDALTGLFERDAFAAIQRSQSVLDGLTELKFVNSVYQSCVGRKLRRHFQENFLCAHALFIQHRHVTANHPLSPALTGKEADQVSMSQNVTASKRNVRYLPCAFTELGA
jgi:hypothetical protein